MNVIEGAERAYWVELVNRVHGIAEGFQSLDAHEKAYFAVNCLVGEVYNGGFGQFFSNSSGEFYEYAIAGLSEMKATQSLTLLVQAKEFFFGGLPVPSDRIQRYKLLPDFDTIDAATLDKLNQAFWDDPDNLGELSRRFARQHQLFNPD